jgi:ATP-dependent DNA ligase
MNAIVSWFKMISRLTDGPRLNGTDLFRVICDRDMEGIVAKQANARYTPEATTWVKIKNREYSQAVGREDFFDRRKARE